MSCQPCCNADDVPWDELMAPGAGLTASAPGEPAAKRQKALSKVARSAASGALGAPTSSKLGAAAAGRPAGGDAGAGCGASRSEAADGIMVECTAAGTRGGGQSSAPGVDPVASGGAAGVIQGGLGQGLGPRAAARSGC